MKLANYLAGEWVEGSGPGIELVDPVTGEELARISSQGADLEAALDFARREGGPRLQQLTYRERAEMLAKVGELLSANRPEYFRLSLLNLGATEADASFDVDGALYTMNNYAKMGRALGEGRMLKEAASLPLPKTGGFGPHHFLLPGKAWRCSSMLLIFPPGAFAK